MIHRVHWLLSRLLERMYWKQPSCQVVIDNHLAKYVHGKVKFTDHRGSRNLRGTRTTGAPVASSGHPPRSTVPHVNHWHKHDNHLFWPAHGVEEKEHNTSSQPTMFNGECQSENNTMIYITPASDCKTSSHGVLNRVEIWVCV